MGWAVNVYCEADLICKFARNHRMCLPKASVSHHLMFIAFIRASTSRLLQSTRVANKSLPNFRCLSDVKHFSSLHSETSSRRSWHHPSGYGRAIEPPIVSYGRIADIKAFEVLGTPTGCHRRRCLSCELAGAEYGSTPTGEPRRTSFHRRPTSFTDSAPWYVVEVCLWTGEWQPSPEIASRWRLPRTECDISDARKGSLEVTPSTAVSAHSINAVSKPTTPTTCDCSQHWQHWQVWRDGPSDAWLWTADGREALNDGMIGSSGR